MKTTLALVAVLVLGCGSASSGMALARAEVPRTVVPAGDATAAAGALNAFGLDLLRALQADGNAVVSPASIAIALGMARAGARGDTATEMDAVLHGIATDDHPTWLNALDAALASRTGTFKDASGADMPVTLRIANAPFAQQGMPLQPDFLKALAERFDAGVRLVDYKAATEQARQAINGWVKDQTEQRIPELLAQGTLDGMTRLVLVNAIYLKAAWEHPFDPQLTKPAAFTRLDGSTLDVATMHLSTELAYAEGSGWRAVDVPYVGGQLAMTIIVPDDLRSFVASLDDTTLAAITDGRARQQPLVDLALPLFGTETKVELADVLSALGMPAAFDPAKADFSGMTTAEQLFIGAVIHQANIDVDEKGTTASAATAVVMKATGAPLDHVTLNVDRPFLFALRDLTTGAIVFLGQITEPGPRS